MQTTFHNRVVSTWNNLPVVVVNVASMNARLKHQHGHLIKFDLMCYKTDQRDLSIPSRYIIRSHMTCLDGKLW